MFCCKGKRLANYLIENGSTIVRIENDRNNSEYLVFLFKNDETIRKNLEKWKVDRDTYRRPATQDTEVNSKNTENHDVQMEEEK